MEETAITTMKMRRALRPESLDCSRENTVLESVKKSTAAVTRPIISHQSLRPIAVPRFVIVSAADIPHKRITEAANLR
jgi:hypothetical protein